MWTTVPYLDRYQDWMEGVQKRDGGVHFHSVVPVGTLEHKDAGVVEPTPIDAPVEVPPPKNAPSLSNLFGLGKPAVAAVVAGALALGCAPGAALAQDRVSNEPVQEVQIQQDQQDEDGIYREAMEELAHRRREGRITPAEYETARAALMQAMLTDRGGDLLLDHDGDVDIEALLMGMTADSSATKTRGQQVMERLARRLEHRMQVTARDMANPNTRFIEGAPGYKEIPQEEVQRLVLDALEDMPLEELPLGQQVAELIARLPAGSNVTPSMSFRELGDAVGEDGRALVEAKLGPFFEDHAVEAGVVAFGAVTGLRYASPDAARLMDGLSVEVWDATTEDDRGHIEAELTYRDQQILPQLDLTATGNTTVGRFDLRGELESTIALEDEQPLQGRVTLGARTENDHLWADGSVSRYLHRDRTRINLSVGGHDEETGLSHATSFTALLDPKAAQGDADGRLFLTFDLNRPVHFEGADGSLGVFAGASMDTDGHHEDFRAGLIFRLRW